MYTTIFFSFHTSMHHKKNTYTGTVVPHIKYISELTELSDNTHIMHQSKTCASTAVTIRT